MFLKLREVNKNVTQLSLRGSTLRTNCSRFRGWIFLKFLRKIAGIVDYPGNKKRKQTLLQKMRYNPKRVANGVARELEPLITTF